MSYLTPLKLNVARARWLSIESLCQRLHLPLPLWESIGRLRRPFFDKNAEAKLRLRRIADAIRVRGHALSMDRNPSPQPSPTRGEGAHLRCWCRFVQSHPPTPPHIPNTATARIGDP